MAEIRTVLKTASRRGHSVNGNPRWTLHTDSGDWLTQTDSACSYDIDNLRRRAERNPDGLFVVLKTTKAGRVWSAESGE